MTDSAIPGSLEEIRRFERLQQKLAPMFSRIFPDPGLPRTVLVIPSLSLHPGELAKITGVSHYEERMLCMLMLLRMPRTHLIYATSQPVAPSIVDYYLHLLPGIPSGHARRRLTLLSCHDASSRPLSQKLLERPRLMRRIREAIADPGAAHMTCFNVTALERSLAVQLDVPIYGCDPALGELGSKSGSREVFREAGVAVPEGFERLRDEDDLVDALVELKRRNPGLRRAVVKLNDGFSGEGNALFAFEGAPAGGGIGRWVREALPGLRFEAAQETWEHYREKFGQMGGIAECFVDGEDGRSPSAQCRIDPLGGIEMLSTHDQILGGPSGQIFLGCAFPAAADYRLAIQAAGLQVARVLQQRGVLGRFGIDFVSVRCENRWQHYAIEINLRKGGTSHTFMMLQFLTDGGYDTDTGLYLTPAEQPRYYYATDNLQSERYRGLTPEDLIDIAVDNNLHFHGATQQGVVFHLIGALSEFGKLGLVCVADSAERAHALYANTIEVLDQEAPREQSQV